MESRSAELIFGGDVGSLFHDELGESGVAGGGRAPSPLLADFADLLPFGLVPVGHGPPVVADLAAGQEALGVEVAEDLLGRVNVARRNDPVPRLAVGVCCTRWLFWRCHVAGVVK